MKSLKTRKKNKIIAAIVNGGEFSLLIIVGIIDRERSETSKAPLSGHKQDAESYYAYNLINLLGPVTDCETVYACMKN